MRASWRAQVTMTILCRALRAKLCVTLFAACVPIAAYAASPAPLPPETASLLDHISADTMRTHLSYLALDELGGRATPSPGLDLAANYIAVQFRRAGLEPLGDDG